MRGVENEECKNTECGNKERGECGVWRMRSLENAECGKCGVVNLNKSKCLDCLMGKNRMLFWRGGCKCIPNYFAVGTDT